MSLAADAAVGGPSRSVSSIVADTAKGYHILKIDSYSLTKGTPTGEFLESHPFTVGGHRWCIRYYPNGDTSEAADYVSLFLMLDDHRVAEDKKAVKAQYRFSFVDEVAEQVFTSEEVCSFPSMVGFGWGYSQFIKREKLEKSRHLKDDSFSIRCDILVIKDFHGVEVEKAEVPTLASVTVPPSNLRLHFRDLLKTGKGADVVFEVGGEKFSAHRCVLAARSPVFSAELLGSMKERDTAEAIRIDDMEATVFKALLHFVYTDSLPKVNKQEEEAEEDVLYQHLLVAADRYNMERLKLICEDKLCKYIDETTAATVLALAEQHHCHGLKKACLDFVVATDGFKHLSRSCPATMEELIAMLSNLVQ
ncbi:hypothetical protein EJB05_22270, partial [Eragrostis curvula]